MYLQTDRIFTGVPEKIFTLIISGNFLPPQIDKANHLLKIMYRVQEIQMENFAGTVFESETIGLGTLNDMYDHLFIKPNFGWKKRVKTRDCRQKTTIKNKKKKE